MSQELGKVKFEITATKEVINRFSRLLWMMQYASRIGHSGYFGMPLDGDGSDRFEISWEENMPLEIHEMLKKQYNEANMSGGLELAMDGSFSSKKLG